MIVTWSTNNDAKCQNLYHFYYFAVGEGTGRYFEVY